jgi:hypothetical protein
MTTTVDQKHRAVTPFQPGDVLEIQQQSPDIVVLKRTKQAQNATAKLVCREGRLVFVGEPITTEEVKGLLEDFPGSCPTQICFQGAQTDVLKKPILELAQHWTMRGFDTACLLRDNGA